EVAAGCARTFLDVLGPTAKERPELSRAIELARAQRRCAENQPVVFTVYDLPALARTAAELIDLSAVLRAADVQLDVRTGPMAGIYDPNGAGSLFFTVLGAAGELDRRHRGRLIEAGQRGTAEGRGRRGGRPKVLDETMLSQARRLRDEGVPVPEIARALTIATGKNAGRHPSLASVYRALAEAVAATGEEPGGPPGRPLRPEAAPSSAGPVGDLS
ncbi:MAG: recombinase family protein, partial [Streptomyces sp.]|nr:recombinase family protein [Streptomyces sp.]